MGCMAETSPSVVFDDKQAWGAYRPTGLASLVLSLCHALPAGKHVYYKLGQTLRGLLKRGAPRMYDVEVESLKLRLASQGNYSERRMLTLPQYYDVQERDWLCSKLAGGGSFLDVGGNAGLFSLSIGGRLREKIDVYTVEPDPQMYQRMLFNASQNQLSIHLAPVALSDFDGEGVLELSLQQRGENSLRTEGAAESNGKGEIIQVPVTTLLHQCQQWGLKQITAMKIDVEGHEDRILSHFMANAERSLWPRAIVMEHVHGAGCIVDRLLQDHGYVVEGEARRNLMLSLPKS